MCAHVRTQTCSTLRPMDCSLPGSSVHGIPRQEYWSGLPFPSPGDLLNPRIRWQVDSLSLSHLGSHSLSDTNFCFQRFREYSDSSSSVLAFPPKLMFWLSSLGQKTVLGTSTILTLESSLLCIQSVSLTCHS